jgi:SAM-dependent methyltransferase
VARWAGLLPPGEVLDLACGGGRHARLLAGLGHAVLALDRDPAALQAAAGPGIITQQCDLETPDFVWPMGVGRFAGVVVANYLHRPVLDAVMASMKPDGMLVYETFARGNEQFGKPSNPAFLLEDGELLALVSRHGWSVLAYEAGVSGGAKPAMVQRLCACGPAYAPLGRELRPFEGGIE